jgi:hypothetical protein
VVLKPVRRLAERRRHDARVAKDEVEVAAVGDQVVGAGATLASEARSKLGEPRLPGGSPPAFTPAVASLPLNARRARHPAPVRDQRAGPSPPPGLTRLSPARAIAHTTPSSTLVGGGCRPKGLGRLSPGSMQLAEASAPCGGGPPGAGSRNKRWMPPLHTEGPSV